MLITVQNCRKIINVKKLNFFVPITVIILFLVVLLYFSALPAVRENGNAAVDTLSLNLNSDDAIARVLKNMQYEQDNPDSHSPLKSWFLRPYNLYILTIAFLFAAAARHIYLSIMHREDLSYPLFAGACAAGLVKFALESALIAGSAGAFSSNVYFYFRLYFISSFLYKFTVLAFILCVFDSISLAKHRLSTVVYAASGALFYSMIPFQLNDTPLAFFITIAPASAFTAYRAARSDVLKNNKITILYFISIFLIPLSEGLQRFHSGRVFYMAGLAAVIYLMSAQGAASAIKYAELLKNKKELVKKAAAMEESASVRSYMIDTIMHEIKTPLTVISTYAQLAAERIVKGKADSQISANLGNVSSEAMRLADFAGNTLKLSRMSEIKSRTGLYPVNVNEIAGHIAYMFQSATIRAGRALKIDNANNAPKVLADTDSITCLLWNLLDNALKHSGEGDIEVSVTENGGSVCLTVKDHGVGVPWEVFPVLFERGVSGGNDGSGLGMDICREIAAKLNGTLILESKPGKGTVVTLMLPAYKEGQSDE